MGENIQFAELELLLRWENYASTESQRKDPMETSTSLHREVARVSGLNPCKEGEEQQGEDPYPHPKLVKVVWLFQYAACIISLNGALLNAAQDAENFRTSWADTLARRWSSTPAWS